MLNKLIDKFKHSNIKIKLMLSFTVVLILTAAVAVTGIFSLISTRKSFSYMINYSHERYLYYADAKNFLMSIRHDFIYMAVLSGEDYALNERLVSSYAAVNIFKRNLDAARLNLNNDKMLRREVINMQLADIDYMTAGVQIFMDDHLLPFAEEMSKNETSGMEIQTMLYRGIAVIDPFIEMLDDMIKHAEIAMRNTQIESNEQSVNMLWLLVIITVVSGCLSFFLVQYVAQAISKPIVKLVEIADNVANGNLDVNIEIESQDETGILSKRFAHVVGVINMFINDLHALGHAFKIDGDTTVRLNESQYKGTYAYVASAINDILEYHVVSKDEILECISSIIDGDYNAPLRQFPGRESRINVSVEILRINVRRMEQIMMQKADADAANKAKSTFLANMSHEIRTPMNTIMGVTEILLSNDRLPEDIAEGLGKIYISCDLLLGIINDILDFSKIEAGKMDIIPANFKIASLINDSIQLNMMRIESKPIEFELNIDENIPANLIGDELRIKQIFNNLLSNAFKYTDKGMVTLTVGFKQNEKKDRITLVISVKDTGHGMTQEQLDKLFIEYSRFHQKLNRTIEGTGLGLSITLNLIELMGGDIKVESEPGEGSEFTVEIPLETIDHEIIGKEIADNLRQFRLKQVEYRKRSQVVRDPMPYGSVLIVDDVETNLYVAEGLMKLYRLKIDSVMSGKEAIEKIKQGRIYDVVFMDHMMPEMDGIETTKQMRDLGYTAPVVALTANAVSGQADVFLENGFDAFISKPIDIRQLNFILNKFVRDKQSSEVIEIARKQNGFVEVNVSGTEEIAVDPLLYDSFIRDASKAVAMYEGLFNNDKFNDESELRKFVISVHGIKSSLANIGEPEFSKSASKLEQDGKDNNIDAIKSNIPGFIADLRALLEKIMEKRNSMTDDVSAEDETVINDIREKMLCIQKACADYDRKKVLDLLTEIKYRSKWTKLVLENIMGYVIHSDFEKAEKEAAAYADVLYGR